MASAVYNTFKGRLLGDNTDVASAINLKSDTIKLMLLSSAYSLNVDSHKFYSDISANEVANSGSYAAGGGTLTTAISTDTVDDEGVFDATDISFTSATIAARYAAIYKSTGTGSTSALILLIDFGSVQTSTAGTFAITFASEGILNLN
jgi:hypothetical protein